jgi:hypothetical protein
MRLLIAIVFLGPMLVAKLALCQSICDSILNARAFDEVWTKTNYARNLGSHSLVCSTDISSTSNKFGLLVGYAGIQVGLNNQETRNYQHNLCDDRSNFLSEVEAREIYSKREPMLLMHGRRVSIG